ncbi:MAG: replicative DNA helicase [Bacillota bacterium]|nr:replicative DNA helicase [Bacillota bacterium]
MSTAIKTAGAWREYPHDLEAERRVLGILIKYPHRIDSVADRLKEEYFYSPTHRLIYQIIARLYQTEGRISYTQIYNHLRKENQVQAPDQTLLELTESFASKAELEPSVEALREAYGRRQILQAAEAIEKLVLQESDLPLETCQARAQELIFQATALEGGLAEEIKDLSEILSRCYVNLVERREGKSSYGLRIGFPSIDLLTTGFKKRDLIILAARPSMGKTSLALNFAVNVARRGTPVLIFSLEMDDEQIGDRLVISEFFRSRGNGAPRITARDYATRLDDQQLAVAKEVFSDLYRLPIKVVDRRGITTSVIRAKARKVKAEVPTLGLIIIDYLQLIQPGRDTNKNWALLVGDIVREIRDLAGELDLPIILLSQLNRGVESRDNKRPLLSDLRDSGNIEEFADMVIFIYRDDYYYPEKARERGTEGQAEVIIAKNRKGETGKAILQFIPEFTRFVDITDRVEE